MKKLLILTTALLFAATLFSCSTTSGLQTHPDYTITEINLQDPELQLITYPQKSGWTKPKTVQDFARQEKCFAAINTNPFHKKIKYLEHSRVQAIGIYVDHGELFAEPSDRYAGLAFFRDGQGYAAMLSDRQSDLLDKKPEVAVGGFWKILEGDTIYPFKDIKNYRSACGISKDGKTLYLFTGKKLSYQECAQILKDNGAWAAMQFDGGSSSQMVLNGKALQQMTASVAPAVILGFKH